MFDENTTLAKILETEHGRKVLAKHGVPCLSCAMASQEIHFLKIGDVADMYKMNKEQIIADLNKKEEKEEGKSKDEDEK